MGARSHPDKAPIRASRITLAVRDLPAVAGFYENIIGLTVLRKAADCVVLGTRSHALVELTHRRGLAANKARSAGLFHSAFLLPNRAALGAWLGHAADAGAMLHGSSDHIVSEAIYLSDPEGNGVEIYVDRPSECWRGPDGQIRMSTAPLDLNDILKAGQAQPWCGFPDAGSLGHVHLQVGSTESADAFWCGVIGLEITTRYPGASFYAVGDYHHHIAANIWNSRNTPPIDGSRAGLAQVTLTVSEPDMCVEILRRANEKGVEYGQGDNALVLTDPWNLSIAIEVEGGKHAG